MVRGSGYGDVVAVAPIMATGVGNDCWQRLLVLVAMALSGKRRVRLWVR